MSRYVPEEIGEEMLGIDLDIVGTVWMEAIRNLDPERSVGQSRREFLVKFVRRFDTIEFFCASMRTEE